MSSVSHRFVVDTDIGTDVDDLLALGCLLGDPNVEVAAITTAYGDTVLRAAIARRICELADRPAIPVVPGVVEPLADIDVWLSGQEGEGIPGLDRAAVETGDSAMSVLAREAAARPGEIDLLAIAPLTNLAVALREQPALVADLGHVWIMGGCFAPLPPDPDTGRAGEHNWAADPSAAALVVESGVAATVCGLDITIRTRLRPTVVEALRGEGSFGELLADQVGRWSTFTGRPEGDPMHDPLTMLACLEPELFEFRSVRIKVAPDGVSTAEDDPDSPLRIVTDVDVPAAEERIFAALRRCCRRATEGPRLESVQPHAKGS